MKERLPRPELHGHKGDQSGDANNQEAQHERRTPALLRSLAKPQDDARKGHGGEEEACSVKACLAAFWRLLEQPARQEQIQHSERQVYEKYETPAEVLDDVAAHRRPEDRRKQLG